MQEQKRQFFLNKFLFYITLWFYGLAFALILLPKPIGDFLGGLAIDWISFTILLIGILAPYVFLLVKLLKQQFRWSIYLPLLFYLLMTFILSTIDFGAGWGVKYMLIGSIFQSIVLVAVLLFGWFVLRKEKAYLWFAYLLVIVILNIGYVIDTAIIFYPEAYHTIPIYSLISYVLSWVLLHAIYHIKENNV